MYLCGVYVAQNETDNYIINTLNLFAYEEVYYCACSIACSSAA